MIWKVITELFGASGRIGRLQYWLGMLAVFAMLAVTFLIVIWIAPIFAIPLIVIAPFVMFVLAIKRLHDRNKSGWWVVVFIIFPGILDRLSDKLTEGQPLWWVLILAGCALSLWGLIEIGFLRGTDGDNEYGPDPLAKLQYRPAPSDEVGSTPSSNA